MTLRPMAEVWFPHTNTRRLRVAMIAMTLAALAGPRTSWAACLTSRRRSATSRVTVPGPLPSETSTATGSATSWSPTSVPALSRSCWGTGTAPSRQRPTSEPVPAAIPRPLPSEISMATAPYGCGRPDQVQLRGHVAIQSGLDAHQSRPGAYATIHRSLTRRWRQDQGRTHSGAAIAREVKARESTAAIL